MFQRTKQALSYFTLIVMCNITFATGETLEDKLGPKVKSNLELLCPLVDICNPNVSEPVVIPNGVLNDRGFTSCCQGCSCHEDCYANINCCFPDEKLSVLEDEMNSTEAQNERLNSLENAPQSFKQCLRARAGTLDETWASHRAYRMVSKPSPGGCKMNDQYHTSDEENHINASCGPESVAPWGGLFPVYSKSLNTIYKNEQCARCHGQEEFTHWTPLLICDEWDQISDRRIPISEHFNFLQLNSLSNHCYVSFEYPENAVLIENLCYVDTIKTCLLSPDNELYQGPSGVNFSFSEIANACNSGLSSHFVTLNKVYENVFCAMCSQPEFAVTMCNPEQEGGKGGTYGSLTFLLDTAFIEKINKHETTVETSPYLQACLIRSTTTVEDLCRIVHCPSGQVLNSDGSCEFPSKRWYGSSFTLFVKLKYKENATISESMNTGPINHVNLAEKFDETKPWPFFWKIVSVFHSHQTNDGEYEPLAAIELTTEITRPDILVNSIIKSLNQPWILTRNETNIAFDQSIFEYSLRSDGLNAFTAWWKTYIEEADLNISDHKSTAWTRLYSNFETFFSIPLELNKLVTCQQVPLQSNEYTLMANKYILKNKLTGTILYDKEFDLVEEEDGKLVPRVCLSDTPFVLKIDKSCATTLSDYTLPIILVLSSVRLIA